MAAIDYQPFIDRVIQRYEGPYGWDRGDPGGPTKFGITCFDLAEERHQTMDSMARWAPIVKAMPLSEAETIYQDKYATGCDFNNLHPGCDCVVLDMGINSGNSRSIKIAQSIVGLTGNDIDGIIGPKTEAAINAYDPAAFINQHCTARLRFLQGLGNWPRFGRGWSARVSDLRTYSLALTRPAVVAAKAAILHEKKITRIPMAFGKGWEGGWEARP